MAGRMSRAHCPRMNKRNVATVLWFMTGWTAGAALAVVVGLPTLIGAGVAVAAAAFVRRDPTGHLWSTEPPSA